MKRLFCGVPVPFTSQLGNVLEAYQGMLKGEDISWVDPANLHITLKFFGQTPDGNIPGISAALHRAAAACPPFSFTIRGCGTFGSNRLPRVIWLGISQADALSYLYQQVNAQLEPLGYWPDKTIFSPHLTIGRVKNLSRHHRLYEVEADFTEEEFGQVEVNRFFLYQSILSPQGPGYNILESFEPGEGHRA